MNLLWNYSHFLSTVQLFLCRNVQLLLKFHFRDCSVRSGNTRYIVDKNKFAAYVISFASERLAERSLKNNNLNGWKGLLSLESGTTIYIRCDNIQNWQSILIPVLRDLHTSCEKCYFGEIVQRWRFSLIRLILPTYMPYYEVMQRGEIRKRSENNFVVKVLQFVR